MLEQSDKRLEIDTSLDFGKFNLEIQCDLSLQGVTGLFGPSGSGKTTLLRILAGLENRSMGSVSYGGVIWQDSTVFIAPHLRSVGYVFQDARLFSHLDVEGNLRYADKRQIPKDRQITLSEVVSILQIDSLLHRATDSLSGGERQRVAIARSLLSQPELLLLDEPLGALDAVHKKEIFPYLQSLHRSFGIPTIYVSHSVTEMAQLADNMIMIDSGRINSIGSVSQVLGREALDWSVVPFEPVAILSVKIVEDFPALHLTRVAHGEQTLMVPHLKNVQPGDSIRLSVRAADVVLATSKPVDLSVRNVVLGQVKSIKAAPGTAFATVIVDVDGTCIPSQVTLEAIDELGIETGLPIYALIKTATFDRSFSGGPSLGH